MESYRAFKYSKVCKIIYATNPASPSWSSGRSISVNNIDNIVHGCTQCQKYNIRMIE